MRPRYKFVVVGLALAGLGAPATAQPVTGPVEIEPAEPTAVDPLVARFTFHPGCPIERIDVERIGARVAVTVVQAEVCPATLYPPEDLEVELGALAAGGWTIEIWSAIARSEPPIGPGSRGGLAASVELEVVGKLGVRAVGVTPGQPSASEPVSATVQVECDLEAEIESDPAARRHTVHLNRLQVFRPCTVPDDDQRYRFDLGPLPAGTHTLVLEERGVGVRGELPFEVSPLPAPSPAPLQLRGVSTDPAQPSTLDPVIATVESSCPLSATLDASDGRLHEILVEELPLGAPCGPSWFAVVELGLLDPGRHTLLVLQKPDEGLSLRGASAALSIKGASDAPYIKGTSSALPPTLLTSHAFEVSPADSRVELLDGRYRITATWRTATGTKGVARGHALTPNAASLWFFEPKIPELMVKVLDGCPLNGHRWVYAAGLTDLEVELVVVDAGTGQSRRWFNASGKAFQPIRDTAAFDGCP